VWAERRIAAFLSNRCAVLQALWNHRSRETCGRWQCVVVIVVVVFVAIGNSWN